MAGKVDFVVRIVRAEPSGDDSPFLGSGVLVGANQVLTCRNVVEQTKEFVGGRLEIAVLPS